MITMQSDVSSENCVLASSNHESTYIEYLPQQSTIPPTVGACNVVSVTPLFRSQYLVLYLVTLLEAPRQAVYSLTSY